MVPIYNLVPDSKALRALELEEIAGVVLEYLNSWEAQESGALNCRNFGLPHVVQEYPSAYHAQLGRALMED